MLIDPDSKSSSDEDDMPAVFQPSPDVAVVKVESSTNDSQLVLTSDASDMPLELKGNEKTSFRKQANTIQFSYQHCVQKQLLPQSHSALQKLSLH